MAYLTESILANQADLPIALPATELRQGDWLTVAIVKVGVPMRLTYRFAQIQLLASTVAVASITALNKIAGNLGLAYLVLRKDYAGGLPGAAGGLDVVTVTALGLTERTGASVVLTEAGTYSWILVNNTKPSSDPASLVPSSTSIDFRLSVLGFARLEFDKS